MASQKWWGFLAGAFLLAILLRVYALAAFVSMLAIILAFAHWWQRRSLQGVRYTRDFIYHRGFPGEILPMQVVAENRKFLPLPWLSVQDLMPRAVGPVKEEALKPGVTKEQGVLASVFSLRWYERDRRNYQLLLRKRGVYRIGPARLGAGDIFGLFDQEAEAGRLDYLTVFPEPLSFRSLGLSADNPMGIRRARRRLFEDPNLPMGVREYQPEDDFRRIHWPATARTGQLQVKVFQPVSAQVLVICLNVSTLANYWEGANPDLLEHLVRVTAALAQQALDAGYRVGLVSNGALAHADHSFRILPGRSPAQMAHLLTALASVTPFVTGTFDRFLMAEAPRLPYGATLLVVSGICNPPLIEALMRLKQRGRRVTLLSFAKEAPPQAPGVKTLHLPFYP